MAAKQLPLIRTHTIAGPRTLVPYSRIYWTQVGANVYLFAEDVCASYDLEAARLRWTGLLPGRPAHRDWPRRIGHALQYRPRLYESPGLVVHLHPSDGASMWVLAHACCDGRRVWQTKIELPAAESWTEPRPAHEGLETEELRALLAQRDDRIAVCVIRSSRRMSVWTADGQAFPSPPWDGGLDFHELDFAGKIVRRTLLRGARLDFYGESSFDGLHFCENRVCDFDWDAARSVTLIEPPRRPAHPISAGDRIIGAWHERRRVHAFSVCRAQPDDCFRTELPAGRGPVNEVVVYPVADSGLVRINQTRLLRIDREARLRFEVAVRPYVYEVAGGGESPLLIGCDGKGTNLYAFDDRTGELLCHEAKPGHPKLLPLPGGDWLAAASGDRLVTVSPDGRRIQTLRADRPLDVAGSFGRTTWSCTWRGDPQGASLDLTTLRLPE